jgi:hypothetical protein
MKYRYFSMLTKPDGSYVRHGCGKVARGNCREKPLLADTLRRLTAPAEPAQRLRGRPRRGRSEK